jgi:hypothetical protein
VSWTKVNPSWANRFQGIMLKGDPKVPSTRWWNHLYLLLRAWKEVTILEVDDQLGVKRFIVGFKPVEGPTKQRQPHMTSKRFAVRHGREDCIFYAYAIGAGFNCTEIPLSIIERTTIDKLPKDVELI